MLCRNHQYCHFLCRTHQNCHFLMHPLQSNRFNCERIRYPEVMRHEEADCMCIYWRYWRYYKMCIYNWTKQITGHKRTEKTGKSLARKCWRVLLKNKYQTSLVFWNLSTRCLHAIECIRSSLWWICGIKTTKRQQAVRVCCTSSSSVTTSSV